MRRIALLLCLATCLLGAAPALSADLDDLRVAGNLQAVWMLRQTPEGRKLYRRPVGQKAWNPLGVQPTGEIQHFQPVGDELHLLFTGGAYAWISGGGGQGGWSYSTGVNLPGVLLAVAEARDLPEISAPALIAAVRLDGPPSDAPAASVPALSNDVPPLTSAPASAPASRPATAPASTQAESWTAVYIASAGRWQLLHAEPGEQPVDAVLCAAGKPWLVRFSTDTPGVMEARAFEAGGVWTPVPFAGRAPADAVANHVLSLPKTGDADQTPVLVTVLPARAAASQPASQPASAPAAAPYVVQVRRLDLPAATAAAPINVHYDNRTLEFPSVPQVLLVGRQIGLLWQSGEPIEMALVSESGSVGSREDVSKSLHELGQQQLSTKIMTIFLAAVLGSVVVSVILLRPQVRNPVFVLPKEMAPASLPRRILAFLIDFLPFPLVASVIISPWMPAEPFEKAGSLSEYFEAAAKYVETFPLPLIVAQIVVMVAFVVYSTLMELRASQTLGKRLLRLAVVGEMGSRPSARSILTRNIMKVFELMLIGNALAGPVWLLVMLAVVPFFTQYRQRLGDLAARTAVIDLRLTRPVPPPEPPDAEDSSQGPSWPPGKDDDSDPPSGDA